MSEPMGPPSERLLRAAASAAAPAAAEAAWAATPPEPAVGQLWRARWAETAELVVLLAAGDGDVEVAPVTLDLEMLDDESVLLPPEQSDLGRALVVWVGLARMVPVRVLDRSPGAVHIGVTALQSADRGPAIESPIDQRAIRRAEVLDALDEFAAAAWAPTGGGNLVEVLGALKPAEVVAALACPPYRALELIRGQQPLTAPEAEALAPLVQRTAEELLQANPALSAELVTRLDAPRRRAQVERLAAAKRLPVLAAWREAAYGVAGLAARRTGEIGPAWEGRIDQYFTLALDE